MINLYVSTVAFPEKPISEIIREASDNGWCLEFSSGLPFNPLMEEAYLNCGLTRLAHNYFPSPKEPFVLNLASSSVEIRNRSIEHCKNGLRLSRRSGSPFYAAHAGFCIDPQPAELGNRINFESGFDREIHWALFIESVNEVLLVAEEIGIDFLIENNVLAAFNLRNGINPLFCCDCEDIARLFNEIKHNRLGLLLDTAHLKVSARTLALGLEEQLQCIQPFVRAVHHSDNDGTTDSNGPLGLDYWFFPFMRHFDDMVHVLEVKNLRADQIQDQFNLFKRYAIN